MTRKRLALPPHKRLLTLPETMALTGFSRTRTYEAAREGTLPGLVRLAGHRMLVRRRVLEAWLEGRGPLEADAELSDAGRDADEPAAIAARAAIPWPLAARAGTPGRPSGRR
jgi:predicted DNA-binding transcriptional regulator AlpA